MDDIELKNLWKSYDQKLEEARVLNMQSWVLNLRSFEITQTHRAKSKLKSLQNFKFIAVILGIAWVAFLVFLVYNSLTYQKIFFVISVGMIALFSSLAIIVYIKHIILLKRIDNSENIVDTQEKLATLQTSTINIVRILWLQMPFYTTFFFSPAFFHDIKSWIISIPITLLFTFLSIWLFRNINQKNTEKKWFKLLLSGPELNSLNKAVSFVKEIDDFRKNI